MSFDDLLTNLRRPTLIFLLAIALLAVFAFKVQIQAYMAPFEWVWEVVSLLVVGVLCSAVVAYLQYATERRDAAARLVDLQTAIFRRDDAGLTDSLRALNRYIGYKSPYILQPLHPLAASLVQVANAVNSSFAHLQDCRWEAARDALAPIEQIQRDIASGNVLAAADSAFLSEVVSLNLTAARHYADGIGIQPTAVVHPGDLARTATGLFHAINDFGRRTTPAIRALTQLCRLSESASPSWSMPAADRCQSCLIDMLITGGLGLLAFGEKVEIEDRTLLPTLGLSSTIGRISVSGERLGEAIIKAELGCKDLYDFVVRIRQRWLVNDFCSIPTKFLRMNLSLLASSELRELEAVELALESSPTVFRQELAIVRLNLCSRALSDEQPDSITVFDRAARQLPAASEDEFFHGGVCQVRAIQLWLSGERRAAINQLEEVIAAKQVFPVWISSLRTLLRMTADEKDGTRFTQLRHLLLSSQPAFNEPVTMESAAGWRLETAIWYFITLPVNREYPPFFLDLERIVC